MVTTSGSIVDGNHTSYDLFYIFYLGDQIGRLFTFNWSVATFLLYSLHLAREATLPLMRGYMFGLVLRLFESPAHICRTSA